MRIRRIWKELYNENKINEMKEKSRNRMLGENNPMFNKHHSDKVKKECSKRIKEWWQTSDKKLIENRNKKVSQSLSGKIKTEEHRRNISKSHNSLNTKIKTRLSHLRELNSNWKGGLSFEPYSVNFNKMFKELIIIRDNKCVICYKDNQLDIHHIDYDKLNTTKENCITLCRNCHTKTNFNREYWKSFFQNLLNEKYNYKYEICVEVLQ
jgi:hypothetical protein